VSDDAGGKGQNAEVNAVSKENAVSLRLSAGPLAGPVLCRVVSMVLVRADWPMDRLDDALLVCDAIAAHAPAYVRDGQLAFTVASDAQGVELHVEALAERGARGLIADATVPGVGNVLERMSNELRVVADGDGPGEKLVLTLTRD
jgi:serine/threonine-protein kinase RsbW